MTTIVVKNKFEDVHCWPEAPEEVVYLRYPHRHQFYVETEIEVGHDDRELEFIMVQHRIDDFLRNVANFPIRTSCEQMARAVGEFVLNTYGRRSVVVTVKEDNENGARVYFYKENLL